MKTYRLIITGILFFFLSLGVLAQGPPPRQIVMVAIKTRIRWRSPHSSGLIILLALGAGYGGKKVYDLKKKKGLTSE